MPIYLCGCNEDDVTDVVDTVLLRYCGGVAVSCPLPLPIAFPDGPILGTLTLVPNLVQELRPGHVVTYNADGCRLDINRKSDEVPQADVTVWPVVTVPIVDTGNGNTVLCPFPTRVLYNSLIYTSIGALASAVQGTFAPGTAVVAPALDGCSLYIAHACLTPPTTIGVTIPPTVSVATVDVIDLDNGNAVLNPVPFGVSYLNTIANSITQLANLYQASLPAGYTVVPHGNGRQLIVTYPVGQTAPANVGVRHTTTQSIPLLNGDQGNAVLCPVPFPVTRSGVVSTSMADFAAHYVAEKPTGVGWAAVPHATNLCLLTVTWPIGTPNFTGIVVSPLSAAVTARSLRTGTSYNDIARATPPTDPYDFAGLLRTPSAFNTGGVDPLAYTSGWIIGFQPQTGKTRMRVTFTLGAKPATLTHPVSGPFVPDPMAVAVHSSTTLLNPTAYQNNGWGSSAPILSTVTPRPKLLVPEVGSYLMEWDITGVDTTGLALVFAYICAESYLSDLEITFPAASDLYFLWSSIPNVEEAGTGHNGWATSPGSADGGAWG